MWEESMKKGKIFFVLPPALRTKNSLCFPPPVYKVVHDFKQISSKWILINLDIERDFSAEPSPEVQIKVGGCLPVQLVEINVVEEGSVWLSFPFHTWIQKQNQSSHVKRLAQWCIYTSRRVFLILGHTPPAGRRFRNLFQMRNKQMYHCADSWGTLNSHFKATTSSSAGESHHGKYFGNDLLYKKKKTSLHFRRRGSHWNRKLWVLAISICPKWMKVTSAWVIQWVVIIVWPFRFLTPLLWLIMRSLKWKS